MNSLHNTVDTPNKNILQSRHVQPFWEVGHTKIQDMFELLFLQQICSILLKLLSNFH